MALSKGGSVSVSTAAQTLTALLGLTTVTRRYPKELQVQIIPGSANTIYWGRSDVTNVPANAHGALVAATTPVRIIGGSYMLPLGNTDEIYFVASAATVMLVTLVE